MKKRRTIIEAAIEAVSYTHLQRFDRTNDSKRIHFASAMTLLGLSDGDNATTGYGYLDIVDFIIQNCTDVERNLQ